MLRYVACTADEDIMLVCRAMLAVSKLDVLEMEFIDVGRTMQYWSIDTPHGGLYPETHRCEGIEPVKEWLRGLLDGRVHLCHAESDPEQ
jgi:hypothetical protein